jgi:predicted RNase H-like nuclease (RuvC/YqgF family)
VISELEDSLRKYVSAGEAYRNQLSQTYELINQLKRDLESAKITNEQYKKDIKSRDTYIQTLTTERDEAKQKISVLEQELNEITFLMGIRIKNFKPVSYGKNSLSFIYVLQQTQQKDDTEAQPSIEEVEVVIWVFRKNKMGEQPQLVNNSSGSNRTREKRPIGDTIRFDFKSAEPIQALDELTGNCIEYIIRFQLIGKNCEIWNEEQPILDLTKIRKI